MKYTKLLILLIALGLVSLPAWAQSANPYDLTWLAFDTAGTASGGQYEVAATVGQLDNRQLHGGDYDLTGRLGNGSATVTSNPTPVATVTPVTGEAATPIPSPSSKLYLPLVRR